MTGGGFGSSINCLGRRATSYTSRDAKEIAKLLTMLPRALAEYGYRDTAVLCFAQEAAPGWQWQKNEKGATTLWEYWNGNASRNHVIHGGDFPAWWAKYSKKAGK